MSEPEFLHETIKRVDEKRDRIMRELHPELRSRVAALLEDLGGRFVPYCGYRGPVEQAAAFSNGKSNARYGNSPHNMKPALACDVVLNAARVSVRAAKDDERYPDLWDDESPDAVGAWADLEKAALRFRLSRVNVNGARDKPHLEMPNWRIYVVR